MLPFVEGTVLLVEDDEGVRRAVGRALRAASYFVHECASGEAAVEFVRSHAGPIDLLVTDVQLSGISGSAAAVAIRAMRPNLPVLQMSGSSRDHVRSGPTRGPAFHFIGKPFRSVALANTVRSILGKRITAGTYS